MKRLTFPAPRKESVESEPGMYYMIPWTMEGVQEALEGGAWFTPGGHDFANKEVAKAALQPTAERLLS